MKKNEIFHFYYFTTDKFVLFCLLKKAYFVPNKKFSGPFWIRNFPYCYVYSYSLITPRWLCLFVYMPFTRGL